MSKETPETKLCKYCKSEIPYDAKVCPHCRKKQTPNGCLIAIIVIVVLFILIGVAGGSSSSSNQNASSSASASSDASSGSSTPSTPTVTHAPSVYSIGDTAESNGVKVTLVNAETGHGSQYLTPSAGNIFVTLEFEIETIPVPTSMLVVLPASKPTVMTTLLLKALQLSLCQTRVPLMATLPLVKR